MKLAIPDVISNAYFPALTATELGFFRREGLDIEAELIFPVDRVYRALHDGKVDFVAGAAHGALAAFPGWSGVRLLAALAQGCTGSWSCMPISVSRTAISRHSGDAGLAPRRGSTGG